MSGTGETCAECVVTPEEFGGGGFSDLELDNPALEQIKQDARPAGSHQNVSKDGMDEETSCAIPPEIQNDVFQNMSPTKTVFRDDSILLEEYNLQKGGTDKADCLVASSALYPENCDEACAQDKGASPAGDAANVKNVCDSRSRGKMHSEVNRYQLDKKTLKGHDWLCLQKLKNMLDKKMKENDILRDTYLSCQRELKAKDQRIKTLVSSQSKIKQLYNESHKVEITANQKTFDYKAVIAEKNIEIYRLHQELARQKSQAFTRTQMKVNENQTDQEAQSNREKKMCLKFKIKGLERELSELLEKKAKTAAEILDKSSKVELVQQHVEKLEKTKDEINRNIGKLNKELKVKQNEKDGINAEMAAMKETIDLSMHYRERSSALQKENETLRAEIATLKIQLSDLANKNIEFESNQRKCSSLCIFEPNLSPDTCCKSQPSGHSESATLAPKTSAAVEFEYGRAQAVEQGLTFLKDEIDTVENKRKGSIQRKIVNIESEIKGLEAEAQSLHEDINIAAVVTALQDQQEGQQASKELCAAPASELETRLIHLLNEKDVIKTKLESLREEVGKQATQVDKLMANRNFLLNVILEYKKSFPVQAKYVKKVERERDVLREKINGSYNGETKKEKIINGLRKEIKDLKCTLARCREAEIKMRGYWMDAIKYADNAHSELLSHIDKALGDFQISE